MQMDKKKVKVCVFFYFFGPEVSEQNLKSEVDGGWSKLK